MKPKKILEIFKPSHYAKVLLILIGLVVLMPNLVSAQTTWILNETFDNGGKNWSTWAASLNNGMFNVSSANCAGDSTNTKCITVDNGGVSGVYYSIAYNGDINLSRCLNNAFVRIGHIITGGTLEAIDEINISFSNNSGVTFGKTIGQNLFNVSNDDIGTAINKSFSIPSGYLNASFRVNLSSKGFAEANEEAYIDNISIYCTIQPSDTFPSLKISFNATTIFQNTAINFSANATDDNALIYMNLTNNQSGVLVKANYTATTTTYNVSNVTIISAAAGNVINFTAYATDNTNQVTQLSQLFTVQSAADTCSCPSSGNWEISDGSICNITTTCDIGSNRLRVNANSGLLIMSTGIVRAGGCYFDLNARGYINNLGALYCQN